MNRAPKNGMTLIEVLLAMLILGMSIAVLMTSASHCLAIIRHTRQYETARHLFQRIDSEFPIDEDAVDSSETSGSFDDIEGYRWDREITEIDEEMRPGLYQITTRIRWTDRSQDVNEQLTTLRYLPEEELAQ